MSALSGIQGQGMASPGHERLARNEHRQQRPAAYNQHPHHHQSNGVIQDSLGVDRPAASLQPQPQHQQQEQRQQQRPERLKRKISSKRFTSIPSSSGLTNGGLARPTSNSSASAFSTDPLRHDLNQQKQRHHHNHHHDSQPDRLDNKGVAGVGGGVGLDRHRNDKDSRIREDTFAPPTAVRPYLNDDAARHTRQPEETAYSTRWPPHHSHHSRRHHDTDFDQDQDQNQPRYQQLPRQHEHDNGRDLAINGGRRDSGGGTLTIRSILDSEDFRNQISELRRSQNSNLDQGHDRALGGVTGRATRRRSSSASVHAPLPASIPARASNLPLQKSPREIDFRANIQSPDQDDDEDGESNYNNESNGQFHQHREEDQEQEQDTVELKRTVRPGRQAELPLTLPVPLSSPKSAQIPRLHHRPIDPLPSTSKLDHQHQRPPALSSAGRSSHVGRGLDENLGYDDGEISFDREVAIARAKRELNASMDKQPLTSSVPRGSTGSLAPSMAMTSRLDHGRDLALEDLVSPTIFDSEARFAQHHQQYQPQLPEQQHTQQRHRPQHPMHGLDETTGQQERRVRAPAANQHMLSIVEDPSQLGMAIRQDDYDDHFFEHAGTLGEGQAVTTVLGTLKAMIRQGKSDKRELMRTIKALQKDIRKKAKEIERMRRANEKLSTRRMDSKAGKERVPQEEQEKESQKVGAQRAKDEMERQLHALQSRIDKMEAQRAQIRELERRRADEEADLLYLMNSGSDDDDNSEDEDTPSGTESESEESDQSEDASAGQDLKAHHTRRRDSVSRRGRSVSPPHSRRSPLTKRQVEAKASRNGMRKHRATSRDAQRTEALASSSQQTGTASARLRPGLDRKVSLSRSKSVGPELTHLVEKVEEVHIHHHVHYGGNGDGNNNNSNDKDGTTTVTAPRRGDGEAAASEDAQRFRPQRRRSATQEHLDIPHSEARSALSRSLPDHGAHTTERHAGALTAEPQQLNERPQSHRQHADARPSMASGSQSDRAASSAPLSQRIDVDGEEGYQPFRIRAQGTPESRVKALTAALMNPSSKQKKFRFDLQRVLSLRKAHNPSRCTVCCNGDGQEHDEHNQHHHRHHHDHDHLQQHHHHHLPPAQLPSAMKATGKSTAERTKRSDGMIPLRRTSTAPAAPSIARAEPASESESRSLMSSSSLPSDDDAGPSSSSRRERDRGRGYRRQHERSVEDESSKVAQKTRLRSSSGRREPPPQRQSSKYKSKGPVHQERLEDDNDRVSKDDEGDDIGSDGGHKRDAIEESDAEQENDEEDVQKQSKDGRRGVGGEDQLLEQKMHAELVKLQEEYRQLRRSYAELLNNSEAQGPNSEAIKERQKKIADSLVVKADVISELQDRYFQKRDQQQQQQQQQQQVRRHRSVDVKARRGRESEVKAAPSARMISIDRSRSGSRRPVKRTSFSHPHRDDRGDNFDDNKPNHYDDNDEEEEQREGSRNGRYDTQDTSRSPSKERRRRIDGDNSDNNNDRYKGKPSHDERQPSDRKGHNQRLGSGIRVPKLH
ncbi:hypothetical protein BGZ99_004922 [Dissophora globulifera]|uniref:Uncharacterized protein n=1 Tax=Dissophora globulifera TaxID=979702 RepID=A0A9P6UZV0_9FUNG|nr:hypothetical protein BGZ99_004922 [Dissophora globulifera]